MRKCLVTTIAILSLLVAQFAIAAEPVKAIATADVPTYLQDISVTIHAGGHQGSGVYKVTKDGQVWVWTCGHLIEVLRHERKQTGGKNPIIEFSDAKVIQFEKEAGRTVGEYSLYAEVIRYSDARHGEDLALLRLRSKHYKPSNSAVFYLDEKIPPLGSQLYHCGSLHGDFGSNSLTAGILSQHGRILFNKVFDQTDCAAVPGSCLPADTIVSMADGTIKRIVDIKPGDVVLCFGVQANALAAEKPDSLRPVRSGKVVKFIEAGDKPIYELKTRNRTLRASGNHPVVKVEQIEDIGGKINNIPVWTRVDQLKEGDIIATMKEHIEFRKSAAFNFNNEIGQGKDKEKFMQFLGFYVGDGYKRLRSPGSGELSLYTYDQADGEKYAQIIREVFGSKVSFHNNGNIVYTGDTELVRNMHNWGFTGLAKTKRIPAWVFQLPRNLQMAFIRGYAEADGTMIGNTWELEAANKELIEQFRMLAIHMGLGVSNVSTRTRVANLDGRDIPSESWSCAIYVQHQKSGADMSTYTDNLSDDLRYDRISSIKLGAAEPTYDLEIDGYHNFFANGILVHNSGGIVCLQKDGRYIGMVVRGAGETFNLIVPVRRMREWAKKVGVEFTIDDSLEIPSEDKLRSQPIDDSNVHGDDFSGSATDDEMAARTWLKAIKPQSVTPIKLLPTTN